jgi:3-oxoacyl-ACP reductase-like protein
MADLDKVIVITGFAEVGPWGSSRTRWELYVGWVDSKIGKPVDDKDVLGRYGKEISPMRVRLIGECLV